VYYNEPNQCLYTLNQPLFFGGVLDNMNVFLMRGGFYGRLSTHLYKRYGYDDDWGIVDVMQYSKDEKDRVSGIQPGDFNFQYQCP
jgi:hypothetical protein